jgi:ATP-dependent helicase HrpA
LADRADPRHWADIDDPQLAHYRWMLEELRVSLFAQELGTSQPVSPQRLEKAMASYQHAAR